MGPCDRLERGDPTFVAPRSQVRTVLPRIRTDVEDQVNLEGPHGGDQARQRRRGRMEAVRLDAKRVQRSFDEMFLRTEHHPSYRMHDQIAVQSG
jgi:hypothetical protein